MKKIKELFGKLYAKFYVWLDYEVTESAKSFLGPCGKTLGHQPTFEVLNPTAIGLFNAGVVVGEKSWKAKLFGKRVIWYGDLNLSLDLEKLIGLSRLAGDTLTVLNRNHNAILRVRAVGEDNEAVFAGQGITQDEDGDYCYETEFAKERNLSYAKDILEQRGWLPGHLLEFYGLDTPKVVKLAKKARKKAAKKANRAKKRA